MFARALVAGLMALALSIGADAQASSNVPYPGHDLVIDYVKILGPAPWPPSVGGGQAQKRCDQPDVSYLPRCRAWQKQYDAYQVKLRALLAEEAAKRGG